MKRFYYGGVVGKGVSSQTSMDLYERTLTTVEGDLGVDVTGGSELLKVCRGLFGDRFHGVYAADEVPDLNKTCPYAILNLDPRGKPGSHWVGLAYRDEGSDMLYDSFGRAARQILPKATGLVDVEDDVEQAVAENNCGPRCVAWLWVVDQLGAGAAMSI